MDYNSLELKPLYPLVIFDLDGTIINSQPSINRALRATLENFKLVVPEDQIVLASFLGIRDLVEDIAANNQVTASEFNQKFKDIFLDLIPTSTEMYPGMGELLRDLSKICCVTLLTNKSKTFGVPTLEALGIRDYFHGVFFHESFKEPKPSAQPVNSIIDQFGFSKNQTLVIGDTIKDIQSAKNALVSSCYVTYGYGKSQVAEIEAVGYQYKANSVLDIAKIFAV